MAAYSDPVAERMLTRKRFCIRVLVDIGCVAAVAVPVLLVNMTAKTYHRGFFCDDQSLMHPLKDDTIPTWLLIVVCMLLPVTCVLVVECLLQRTTRCCILVPTEIPLASRSYVESSYRTIMVFFFGAAITQLLTEIGKTSIGRLRPHFLTVCQPKNIPANCSGLYITEDVCTGKFSDFVKSQVRLSFPSGHASMSMYAAFFIILYLQARLVCSQAKLLRPVLQVAVFCMAFFTSLSRISDYMHHWSDVLIGAVMGTTVCFCVVMSLSDFHRLTFRRPLSLLLGSGKEHLPMFHPRNNNASSSSSLPEAGSLDTIQVQLENQKL